MGSTSNYGFMNLGRRPPVIVRPVTDRALDFLKAEVSRPISERGVKDIMDAEGWIPGLIARIEADSKYIERLQDQKRKLVRSQTADQVIRTLLDDGEG